MPCSVTRSTPFFPAPACLIGTWRSTEIKHSQSTTAHRLSTCSDPRDLATFAAMDEFAGEKLYGSDTETGTFATAPILQRLYPPQQHQLERALGPPSPARCVQCPSSRAAQQPKPCCQCSKVCAWSHAPIAEQQLQHAVFVVRTEPHYARPWQMRTQRASTGSGFVTDTEKRLIMTNAHVVRVG